MCVCLCVFVCVCVILTRNLFQAQRRHLGWSGEDAAKLLKRTLYSNASELPRRQRPAFSHKPLVYWEITGCRHISCNSAHARLLHYAFVLLRGRPHERSSIRSRWKPSPQFFVAEGLTSVFFRRAESTVSFSSCPRRLYWLSPPMPSSGDQNQGKICSTSYTPCHLSSIPLQGRWVGNLIGFPSRKLMFLSNNIYFNPSHWGLA